MERRAFLRACGLSPVLLTKPGSGQRVTAALSIAQVPQTLEAERAHSFFERFRPGCRAVSEHLWFEDEQGTRCYPDWTKTPAWPQGYPYMVTRHAGEMRIDFHKADSDGGSDLLGASAATWSEDLVLALVLKADYRLRDAIAIAGTACERCMNSLAFALGLGWGYPEGGKQWRKTNTSCEFCREAGE